MGKRFEQAVAELYRKKGYEVRTNVLLKGRRSGVLHEVDVYAERGRERVAVECKYRELPKKVDKSEVAEFLIKLDDLEMKGYLVTNSKLDESARKLAKSYDVKLLEGSSLTKEFREHGVDFFFFDSTGRLARAVKATIELFELFTEEFA